MARKRRAWYAQHGSMDRPDPDEIRSILVGGERADVEFKTSLADSRSIIETIAAMATIGGGTILVGVRDDGRIVGVNVGRGEIERLSQQILAQTDPKVYADIDDVTVDGKRVLRIAVPPGDGPHLGLGRAFHRAGRTTVAMTRDEYERRLLDRLRESSGYERRIEPGVSMADVDPDAVDRFLRLARPRLPERAGDASPRAVVEYLHLGRGDALPLGGLLLFGRDPQGPLPQAVIRAHAERGAAEDSLVCGGTLIAQIDAAVAFAARNLRTRPQRDGVVRRDLPEIPLVAVREVVTNAVAHRDYRSAAAIQLRLDDTGLEVWNPGHLPPPLTAASLRERHPSIPPNPLIARALFLAGYVEEWGTGTLRVIEAMRENGNPEVVFEADSGAGVRIALPLPGAAGAALGERAASVLDHFPRGAVFRSADWARRAMVSPRTAMSDLAHLEGLGLVKRVGRGRSTRWVRP